jgi:hypothetical protein
MKKLKCSRRRVGSMARRSKRTQIVVLGDYETWAGIEGCQVLFVDTSNREAAGIIKDGEGANHLPPESYNFIEVRDLVKCWLKHHARERPALFEEGRPDRPEDLGF